MEITPLPARAAHGRGSIWLSVRPSRVAGNAPLSVPGGHRMVRFSLSLLASTVDARWRGNALSAGCALPVVPPYFRKRAAAEIYQRAMPSVSEECPMENEIIGHAFEEGS